MMFEQPLTKPTYVDWARLAAFIDGEGSVYVCKRSNSTHGHRRMVNVSNTNLTLICWLAQTFGGGVYTYKREPHKTKYVWSVIGQRAASIIRGVLPYLIVKRREAKLLLEFDATFISKNGWAARTIPWVAEKRDDIRRQLRELHRQPATTDLSLDSPVCSEVAV